MTPEVSIPSKVRSEVTPRGVERSGVDIIANSPNEIAAEVQRTLLSDHPDLARTEEQVSRRLCISTEQARALIYEIVRQVNSHLFPPITHMELIHTEGCNLACSYCFEKAMLGPRRMPLEIGLSGIDLLFAYSGNERALSIIHFGGEPTINFPAIQRVTEYAEKLATDHGKTIDFHMTSNGVILNDEMAAYFAKHHIMVLLSIDGLEASHDRFRVDKQGRGTFQRVMKAFHILKNTQRWVGIKMTVMPENVDKLFDDVVGLYQLGINQFLIGYATGLTSSREDMESYIDELARVYRWYKANPDRNLKISGFEDVEENKIGFGCQAGRNSITVSISGEISPCSKILALNNKQLLGKLGDVRYGITHLRNRFELSSCNKLRGACEELGIAADYQGGCFASNYEDNRDLFRPNMQDHEFSLLKRTACSTCTGCGR